MLENRELGTLVNSVLEKHCPEEIRKFLSAKSVLAGGSLLFCLTDGYIKIPEVCDNPKSVDFLKKISTLLGKEFSTPVDQEKIINDYDIYTELSKEEVINYFYKYDYKSPVDISPDELIHRNSYLNVLRLQKKIDNGFVKVDVIFTNFFPGFFIEKEFDFGMCKLWFNGTDVQYYSKFHLDDLNNRIMSFSFDEHMTINHHKTTTTGLRLLKYRQRGFMLQCDPDFFDKWYNKFLFSGMKYFVSHCNIADLISIIREKISPYGKEINEIEEFNSKYIHVLSEFDKLQISPENKSFPKFTYESLKDNLRTSFSYRLLYRFYQCLISIKRIDLDKEYEFPLQPYQMKQGYILSKIARFYPELVIRFIDKCVEHNIILSLYLMSRTLRILSNYPPKIYTTICRIRDYVLQMNNQSYTSTFMKCYLSWIYPEIKFDKYNSFTICQIRDIFMFYETSPRENFRLSRHIAYIP